MTDSHYSPHESPSDSRPPPLITARPVIIPAGPPPPRFGDAGPPGRAATELLILLAAFLPAQAVSALLLHSAGVRDMRWVNVLGSVVVGAILLLAVGLILLRAGRPPRTIGFRSDFLLVDAALGVAMTLLVLCAFTAVAVFLAILAPQLYARLEQTPKAIQAAFPRMRPAWLLLLSAWVAVFEETLFRGFLLTRIHAIVRSWPPSVLLGAAAFALPHFYEGSVAMAMIFLLGTVMGIVFVWRKSLVPVIVLHFVFNSIELMALYISSPEWT